MNKKIIYWLLSLFIYLIVFSVLGSISYKLYYNFCITESANNVLKIFILTIIVAINIITLYGVNYFINKIPRIYFIINSVLLDSILGFIYVYYIVIKGTACSSSSTECLTLLSNVQIIKIILILGITYSILYIIMFNIANKSRKPVDFLPKKK